ncbi:unnamed protein product [Rangifer tarandus platyrhynchus]|uniref:Uncharacterized protein n=2 Tax=Rangifer tarandus platyrhynchus TaxID=3082113 RepID=A0ABN8ZQD7_RANTA|nr:unnamed protein product [Rangifer tarandus platyrhynchus]
MDCNPPGSSLSMGLPRQARWSGLPFPPPGDLPNPRIEPLSLTLADGLFTTAPPGKSTMEYYSSVKRNEVRINYNVDRLKTLCQVTEDKHSRPHILRFQLHAVTRVGKSRDRQQISGC